MRSPRLHCSVAVAEVLLFWHPPERLRDVLLAVSERVRKLEEELAVQLVTRNQRTVRVGFPADVVSGAVVHTLSRFARERPEVEVLDRQRDPYAVEQVVAAIPDAFPGAAGVLPLSRLTDPASAVVVPFGEARVPSVQRAPSSVTSCGAPAQLPSSEAERCHLSAVRFVAVAAQAEHGEFRCMTVDRVA